MTDPARAARLTAIAERRRKAVAGDPYPFADIDTLSALVETLEREKESLNIWIRAAVEAASVFQVGGELDGKLLLGSSTVVDGIKWLLAERKSAEQENARLTAASSAWREAYEESLQRRDQAEQARDTAHAALKYIGDHYASHQRHCVRYQSFTSDTCTCGLDAALQPAPAQETERGR